MENTEIKYEFWGEVIEKLSQYGKVKTWKDDYFLLDNHDGICGVKLFLNNDDEECLSIISHKHSYGDDDEFESMPELYGEGEGDGAVQGYMTKEEVLNGIDIFMNNIKK